MAKWHALPTDAVLAALQTSAATGLTVGEAARRRQKHGGNELRERAQETLWHKFFKQFKDVLVLILIAASLISIIVGEFVDSLVILAIVLLNAMLGVFQEAKAEKALAALKKMTAPHSKVIRDGNIASIPSQDLVPGDIVILEAGAYIPADMRILEAVNLKIDESSLTGESVPVEKSPLPVPEEVTLADRSDMGYMGTVATYGRGVGVVTETAMATEIGKIAAMLQTAEDEETPLQRKLAEFGKTLGAICVAVCVIVFALGIYEATFDGQLTFAEFETMLMTAISLAVAAIPEGLPAVVTVVLALGMQRMVKRHAIVKKLHAVETLGSVSVICSDKTGTLTQNQMTVVRAFAAGQMYHVSGDGYKPEGEFQLQGRSVTPVSETELALLLRGALLCNDAELQRDSQTKTWKICGDPTEGALVVAAAKAGYTRAKVTVANPRIGELPFDSHRKMMTTFHNIDGVVLAFTKGAPDVLLERCTHLADNGAMRALTAQDRENISHANSDMASQALRVLAVAMRRFDGVPAELDAEMIEKDLVFIGLMGMIDPPRREVREAVRICEQAGIRPVMITGDHPATAFAIAKDLNIAWRPDQVVTGHQLAAMTSDELHAISQQAHVFARVSPEHKVAIVAALRQNGHIIAMTGDGVNDAPALKKADIGVAMGITGTDVTKEAADMVVSDDNFASIVQAVEEGRIIYTNIRKFVHFLLSCNAAEIAVILFAVLFGWAVPLLPIQLLWVNLVTDALPALALGVEKKEPHIMRIKPRDPHEPLLSKTMLTVIGVQSLVMAAAVLGAYRYGFAVYNGGLEAARTFAFITLIAAQLLYAYAARSENYPVVKLGLFSNRYLNIAVAASFGLTLISVYGPLHMVFKTMELAPRDWSVILTLAATPFMVAELIKWGMSMNNPYRSETETSWHKTK